MTPLTNRSYETGTKIRLESVTDKGSNMSYVWRTRGTSYTLENPEVVYDHIGDSIKNFLVVDINLGRNSRIEKTVVVVENFEKNP